MIQCTFGNGLLDQRSYDLQDRLTQLELSRADASTIDSRSYQYDAKGSIFDRASTPQNNNYHYDALDRLTEDNYTSNNNIDQLLYRYDDNHNRLQCDQETMVSCSFIL